MRRSDAGNSIQNMAKCVAALIYQRDSIRRHRNDAAAEWFKQPQKNPFALFLQNIFAPIAEQLNNVGGGELIEDIFLFRVWSHY